MLAWIALGAFYVRGNGDDWRIFWSAGHAVGTPALLTASQFVYTPGAAWLLWPFAQMPIATGYFLYVAIMVGLAVAAAWLAAEIYVLPLSVTALMALAWGPFTIAICLGQNSPLALALVTLTIAAIVRAQWSIAGVAVGLLLYKPSDAVALLFLLLVLKAWRSLGVAGLCAAAWYLLSAAATHDWLWPIPYAQTLATLYRSDVVTNADFAISVPTLLSRFGMPTIACWGAGAAMLVASAPLLLRVSRLEAASIVPLIGVAASPHAWGYEAMLALPALWLAVTRVTPLRGVLVLAAYAVAPLYLYARELHFNALAIPVLGGVGFWAFLRIRPGAGRRAGWRFDPSSSDEAERVRAELRRALELHERADALARLDIVYAELVSNAIRHAPGLIEMLFECSRCGGDVVLHVKDRGPGYRANSRLPRDIMSENGRGLFIISTYADLFVVKRRLRGGSHARIWLKPAPIMESESATDA